GLLSLRDLRASLDELELLCTLPAKYRLDCLEHDQQIEPKGHVFDVVEIELQLFASLGQARAISIPHLRPTRQSRANHMPEIEVRNLFREPRHKLRPFRARPDKSPIGAQHIPELRNLVEPRLPHELAAAGHSWLVFVRTF